MPPSRDPSRFVTTRWSLILSVREGATPEARAALSTLCELYWSPLYALIRRQGLGPDDAHDLVQGFFIRLLERDQFTLLERERGRFRSWLRASLQHYLVNEWERERALKRGGDQVRLSIDEEEAERLYGLEPAHELTPERLFERCWAMKLLEHVLASLRESYDRSGKGLLFEKLQGLLTSGVEQASYLEISEELGMSPGAVRVAAHRLRRKYKELLREAIAHTVENSEDIDEEIRLLLAAL
jgi:RNA polymerase sigma factor (sigma-70 family)